MRDTRYAFRTMRTTEDVHDTGRACLALGIGANTTIFSFMDSILFRELPVEKPAELVILQWTANRPTDGVPWGMPGRGDWVAVDSRLRSDSWPYPVFELFEEHGELFSDVFGSQPVSQLRVDDGDGPTADGLYVTGNFFRSLGVGARAGTVAGGRRRPLRCVAGCRALVGLQHGTLRLGRGRCRTIDPYQRRRVHRRRRRAAVVLGLDPERRPSFYLADEVRPAARGGEPASRATRRRRAGRRDARRQHARDVRKSKV